MLCTVLVKIILLSWADTCCNLGYFNVSVIFLFKKDKSFVHTHIFIDLTAKIFFLFIA